MGWSERGTWFNLLWTAVAVESADADAVWFVALGYDEQTPWRPWPQWGADVRPNGVPITWCAWAGVAVCVMAKSVWVDVDHGEVQMPCDSCGNDRELLPGETHCAECHEEIVEYAMKRGLRAGGRWPRKVEAWAFYDKDGNVSSNEVAGPCAEYTARRQRQVAEDPDLVRVEKVWEMEAQTWIEAMCAWHDHAGFEPYRPMDGTYAEGTRVACRFRNKHEEPESGTEWHDRGTISVEGPATSVVWDDGEGIDELDAAGYCADHDFQVIPVPDHMGTGRGLKFWLCPRAHSMSGGLPTAVTWEGDVATCVACGLVSASAESQRLWAERGVPAAHRRRS